MSGRVHDRAVETLLQVLEGAPLRRAIEQTTRRARDLGPRERRALSELVYGAVRSRRRIDDTLERGLKAVRKKPSLYDPPMWARLYLLTHRALEGESLEDLKRHDDYAVRRVAGLFERMTEGRLKTPKRTPVVELAIEQSLPDWLAERLVAEQGFEEAERIASALTGRAPVCIRANRLKISRDELRERLAEEHGLELEPTSWAPDGLLVQRGEGGAPIHKLEALEEGLFEVQDEGSQLIAEALGAQPGELVIDACAGAGGKTLALAARMEGRGRLLAHDVDASKLEELKKRVRRAELTNVETFPKDFVRISEEWLSKADRVLVDAPCSGTGRFRREPDAKWRLEESAIDRFVSLQKTLLQRAGQVVRPGGVVVYATCSVLKAENEDLVDAVVRDSELVPIKLETTLGKLAKELGAKDRVRIGPGPGDQDPDGFFIQLLRRRQSPV